MNTSELWFEYRWAPFLFRGTRPKSWWCHLTPKASAGAAITFHPANMGQCCPLACKGRVVLPTAARKITTAVIGGLPGEVAPSGKLSPARKMKSMPSNFLWWLGLFWELDPASLLRQRSGWLQTVEYRQCLWWDTLLFPIHFKSCTRCLLLR